MYDLNLDVYVIKYIYGEGISDIFKLIGRKIFGKIIKKVVKSVVKSVVKKVVIVISEYVGKKVGDKIVEFLNKNKIRILLVLMELSLLE